MLLGAFFGDDGFHCTPESNGIAADARSHEGLEEVRSCHDVNCEYTAIGHRVESRREFFSTEATFKAVWRKMAARSCSGVTHTSPSSEMLVRMKPKPLKVPPCPGAQLRKTCFHNTTF